MNAWLSRMMGWCAAGISMVAVSLVVIDVLSFTAFFQSAFKGSWTMTDKCDVEQIDDGIKGQLTNMLHSSSVVHDQLKFPLRLNTGMNVFIPEGRAVRVNCLLKPDDLYQKNLSTSWLVVGPIDGDLALWVDGFLEFSVIGSSAFPVIPLRGNKESYRVTIITRPMSNGQLAMTSLFPMVITDTWKNIFTIQKTYLYLRSIFPFSMIMMFIGLSILFVVSYNFGIRYPDVRWTMIGFAVGLIDLILKWQIGVSSWWNYEIQIGVYSCLAVALACHIHRDLSSRLQVIILAIPTSISLALAFLDPTTRVTLVAAWKVSSWVQVILYSGVALSGMRNVGSLPRSRARARRVGIGTATLVVCLLVATNLLIELRGVWLREIALLLTTTITAGIISTDLVLFHRGYFREKALRTDEEFRRQQEEREKLRLAEALLIGKTAQELLLPMEIERRHGDIQLTYRCQPHITMAGDWMDSWQCPDGRVVVLIGDVSGKGPSAAIAMASIMTLTQEFRVRGVGLKEAVEAMSPRIFDLFKGSIVSTWAGVEISADRGMMKFAGGGSPGWFLVSAGEARMFNCRLPMMGLSRDVILYEEQAQSFEMGMKVVSVSDGICGSSRQLRQFHERLKGGGSKVVGELIADLFEFASALKIADDRSLIVIEQVREQGAGPGNEQIHDAELANDNIKKNRTPA